MIATAFHLWATAGAVAICVYVLPSAIAFSRRPPNAGSIYVINLLLGWTIWGWVMSLAMAVRSNPVGTRNASKIYGQVDMARKVSSVPLCTDLNYSVGAPSKPTSPRSTLDAFLDQRGVVPTE